MTPLKALITTLAHLNYERV